MPFNSYVGPKGNSWLRAAVGFCTPTKSNNPNGSDAAEYIIDDFFYIKLLKATWAEKLKKALVLVIELPETLSDVCPLNPQGTSQETPEIFHCIIRNICCFDWQDNNHYIVEGNK